MFSSGAIFSKMVHCILQHGAPKYGAKILFIQQSGNKFEGDALYVVKSKMQ